MPSVTTTTHHQPTQRKTSSLPPTKPKTTKSPRTVLVHHPMVSPPLDDWVLFPQETVRHKHSTIRYPQHRKQSSFSVKGRKTIPPPDSHVIKPKAATSPRCDESERPAPKPYRPSMCLEHMSARNCTSFCARDKSPRIMSSPPKAPSPPRLPTPDLSDVDDEDLWSCCKSSESNDSCGSNESKVSGVSTHGEDDFWGEMSRSTTIP